MNTAYRTLATLLPRVTILTLLSACEPESPAPTSTTSRQAATSQAQTAPPAIRANLGAHAEAALAQSLQAAVTAREHIEALLTQPNQTHLQAAQDAWWHSLLSYRHYFYFTQFTAASAQSQAQSQAQQLTDWIAHYPIQPGFIDKFGAYRYSGLVHDLDIPLSLDSLTAQHGLTDASEVVLGLYPLGFLLFDVDLTRSIKDFQPIERLDATLRERGFEQLSEVPNNRRRTLLRLQAQALEQHLRQLQRVWQKNLHPAWAKAPATQQTQRTHDALNRALAQLLLDSAALAQAETPDIDSLPLTLYRATPHQQQQYLSHAIASLQAALEWLDQDLRVPLAEQLQQAQQLIDHSQHNESPPIAQPANTIPEAIPEATPEKMAQAPRWRQVFEVLKQARDLLNDTAQ